jgi:hypothetical protein
MSAKRVAVEGASLVWIVERTKWPVRAACTTISAVSKSRVSPTMMTSGSWRKKARRAVAKVMPALRLTWTWARPGSWYSTGSSTVMKFFSIELMVLMIE